MTATSNKNGHVNVEDVKLAARGRWRDVLTTFGFNGDDAFANGTKMIGVDLDPDGRDLCQIRTGNHAYRRSGFTQIHRHTDTDTHTHIKMGARSHIT